MLVYTVTMNSSDGNNSNTGSVSGNAAKPWEHVKPGEGSGDDPLAVRFVSSLDHDYRLYKHDIAGSVAHARMLAKVGLITQDELKQIETGLAELQSEIESERPGGIAAWPGWNPQLEDVHMCLEAALIEKIGDAGRKLHTGRSRNDQVALDLKLWIKEAAGELGEQFDGLFRAFVDLAQRDGQIVMPAYTHLQRAQPIVVGGEVMAWLSAFDRTNRRVDVLRELNAGNPLGSGAVAGSGLPLDRDYTAEALGIGPPTGSSIDATASRDAGIDFVYALAMTAMTLSRWAQQWITYASGEFGFIQLDGRYTTGSSMMPQKSNPDMLELIRGRCGTAYGHLMALMTMCKGLGIGYFRDLQQDKQHIFGAYDTVRDGLEITSKIVATTRFSGGRINKGLGSGFIDATSLADYLVTKGVPFRTAHQIVGGVVSRCQAESVQQLSQVSVETFNQACNDAGVEGAPCGPDVYDWLGAEKVVKRYRSFGNAGVEGFSQQLAVWQARLGL